MWHYALWGFAGAAINRAVRLLEANRKVKGVAWKQPEGPGGGPYAFSVAVHCAIGAVISYAAAASAYIHTPLLGVGLGASAVVAAKTVGQLGMSALGIVSAEDSDEDGL